MPTRKNANKHSMLQDSGMTNKVIPGEPVTTSYSTSEEPIVLPAPEFDGNAEFSFSPFHVQYVLGGNKAMVDLSEYDSIFDAVEDLKANWEPESYYRPLPEEVSDEKEEQE